MPTAPRRCPHCIHGRLMRDAYGDACCLQCGWTSYPLDALPLVQDRDFSRPPSQLSQGTEK